MPRHLGLFFISLCLLLGLAASGKALALETGDKMPRFELKTLSGSKVTSDDFLNKQPLMIVFWNTWCPYCRKEVSVIKDLYSTYKEEGLAILAINTSWRDSLDKMASFQEKYEINYPLAYDHNREVTKEFKIVGVPTIYVVNKQGQVEYKGYSINDEVEELIQKLL